MKIRWNPRGEIALLLCVLLMKLMLPAWGETAGRLQETDGVMTCVWKGFY
ncbi:MAG TPA: hypothetical protein PKN45_02360 [Candidatus Limiplasma sp.]|nr:hypothetical protein [Candidatus Limiplasma sp.]HPR77427.1 hypothetical protein [Candidatus Limiplasma sp.]